MAGICGRFFSCNYFFCWPKLYNNIFGDVDFFVPLMFSISSMLDANNSTNRRLRREQIGVDERHPLADLEIC